MRTVYYNILQLIGNTLFFMEEGSVDREVDWQHVYDLGQQHQILPLLYAGIKVTNASVPASILQNMKAAFCTSIAIEGIQQTAIREILKSFDKNGIDYLPLKGLNIKKLYPDASLRPMGDADILIRMGQYAQIRPILMQMGFSQAKESDHEYVWNKDDVLLLELHKRLISSRNSDFLAYFGDGWNRAKHCADGTHRYMLSTEDEFIFLFAHFAKHYRASGIGIRHIVDIAVCLHAHSDMKYVFHELEQIGLKAFFENVVETLQV